jgi:hypothetical protein
MPTLKVWPASLAAAEDAAALEAVPDAVLEADEPQPVRPRAEAAAGDHVHGFHSGCSFLGAGGM